MPSPRTPPCGPIKLSVNSTASALCHLHADWRSTLAGKRGANTHYRLGCSSPSKDAILVPALWSVEIKNALLMAERRKRVRPPEIRRFVQLRDGLTVILDSRSVTESVSEILPTAREYGLSAYDAAYLDVAVRNGAPLATLDRSLRKAGRKAAIEIFSGSVT